MGRGGRDMRSLPRVIAQMLAEIGCRRVWPEAGLVFLLAALLLSPALAQESPPQETPPAEEASEEPPPEEPLAEAGEEGGLKEEITVTGTRVEGRKSVVEGK